MSGRRNRKALIWASLLILAQFLVLIPDNVNASPTYEDFTTYTELDPDNRIDKTANHIDFISRKDEDARLYKDKGLNYFGSIFEHFLDVRLVEADSIGDFACVWAVSNKIDDIQYWRDYSMSYYSVFLYRASIDLRMVLEEKNNGSAPHNDYASISLNTWYYLRIVKKATSLQCKIYSTSALRDIGATPDVDTLSLTVTDNSFQVIFACNTLNVGSPLQAEVDIEKFDLRNRIIEYDEANNIITFLGFSNDLFEDIYLADQAGGWGVFTKTGNNAYASNTTKIDIGDGEIITIAYDKSCSVNMFGGTSTALTIKNNTSATFGTLLNSERKSTSNGVSFLVEGWYYWQFDEGSTVNFYSCSVVSDYNLEIDMYGNGNIYNSMFTDGWFLVSFWENANYDVFNLYASNDQDTLFNPSASMNFEGLRLFDSPYLIWFYQDYPCNITNFYGRGATEKSFYVERQYATEQAKFFIVNGDLDVWNFKFSPTVNVKIFRQYTFNLAIFFQNGTTIENANVTISNDYLGISDSWLTFANGSIPMQVYSMGHYNQTGGDNIYDYNPYLLTVTFDGLETYSTLFNIEAIHDLKIALCEAKPRFFPYFGLGAVFALMIGLVVGLAFASSKRK